MENLLIYPFEKKNAIFSQELSTFIDNINSTVVCSLDENVLDDYYVNSAIKSNKIKLIYEKDFCDYALNSTAIIFLNSLNVNVRKLCIEKIKFSLSNGLKVVILMELTQEEENEINVYDKTGNLIVKIGNIIENEDFQCEANSNQAMFNTTIPVVFIGSIYDSTNKQNLLLRLASQIKSNDKNVYCIGREKIYDFLGFCSYDSLLKQHLSPQLLIKQVNSIIKYVCLLNKPDILLIELPGTFMRYNNIITNDFGVYAYIFTQIIMPNITICCTFCNDSEYVNYDLLAETIERKFDISINFYHLDNCIVDYEHSLETRKLETFSLSIEKYIKEYSKKAETIIPLISYYDINIIQDIFDKLI